MKIKDLQFARNFILNEMNLEFEEAANLLNIRIEIKSSGTADSIDFSPGTINYSNPSSISKFIYKTLYSVLSQAENGPEKDKMALGLFYHVRDYVYADFNSKSIDLPVLISFDKLTTAFIVHEIIEPLIGALPEKKILFAKSKIADICQSFRSKSDFESIYGATTLASSDFPLILVNSDVHNSAARDANLLVKYLDSSLGTDKTSKIIKNILLNNGNSHILQNLVLLLRNLNGNAVYVSDFIKYLSASIDFSDEEKKLSLERQSIAMVSDKYLSQHMKFANDGMNTSQVFRQWSQWSLLLGLIEKQLSPMRGSMWPASELIKPHEDKLKLLMQERARQKNKNQLNFEELLETARELYDHNAIEPGKLIEVVMKDERIWKS